MKWLRSIVPAVVAWLKKPAPPAVVKKGPTLQQIEKLEEKLLPLPQVDMPLTHRFAPHVYAREIFMPANTFVIGHEHKTKHFNVVLTGRARVINGDDVVQEIVAPAVFTSDAGVRKILYIIEDMRWMTIHPTDETDVEALEEQLCQPSKSYITYHELQKLAAADAKQIGD